MDKMDENDNVTFLNIAIKSKVVSKCMVKMVHCEVLTVGSIEALLLQMQPYFVAHLEVVWHLMLIMLLLVLSINSFQYVMNPLEGIFNALDEVVRFVRFRLAMSRISLSSHKWHGYVNRT